MSAAIEAHGLGLRRRGRWALTGCTLSIPAGRVVGLVGPNGAGKTTLLSLAAGLLTPTTGSITVLGDRPAAGPAQLARIGFVAQDPPLYASLSVTDHLRYGAHLNPGWDAPYAAERIARLGLDPRRPAGKLSGGQRAQLVVTLALAKRPELLILDEPVASLDPLARRDFLRNLADAVAERQTSVVLSSHLVGDLDRVCDYLIVLADGRVQIADDIDRIVADHHLLTAAGNPGAIPTDCQVISVQSTSTMLVRAERPIADPAWAAAPVGLEDVVLAYMTGAADGRRLTPEGPK